MNSIVRDQFDVLKMTVALRDQLLDVLSDSDLRCTLPGHNLSLGALCREMGEVQHAYIESYRTFTQDFSYRNPEPGLDTSVAKLKAWFQTLDIDLYAVLEGLSEEDIQHKAIERGGGFNPLPTVQLHVFREGLLIFYGKASIYLKAMEQPLPGDWPNWIA
jgi:hypothetical protein